MSGRLLFELVVLALAVMMWLSGSVPDFGGSR
jgi:hypothetical protein